MSSASATKIINRLDDGRLYGRGTANMKCGTAASFITYWLLHKHRDKLAGRLTLSDLEQLTQIAPEMPAAVARNLADRVSCIS